MGSIETVNTLVNHTVPLRLSECIHRTTLDSKLSELYSENIVAKVIRTADKHLLNNNPPTKYPEIVPQSGNDIGNYKLRNIDFWTCGFFPGCIYSLLERAIKYPDKINISHVDLGALRRRLEDLGRTWSDPIHQEARLTDTHDLGFIIMTHMKPRWELFHDEAALSTILRAAKSLYTRFHPKLGVIRSWDQLNWQHAPHITGLDDNFMVIIDSLCNLDLLFYAAAHSGCTHLSDTAQSHARALIKSHLRPEPSRSRKGFSGMLYSTAHLVNFCPRAISIKEKRSVQGYDTWSTWSRGQAWAILGYAQTFAWTRDPEFLDVACGLAEYFLLRMESAPDCVEVKISDHHNAGRYVPMWDFDAPVEADSSPLRDTSAGTAAANGILILAQSLAGLGKYALSERYRKAALDIVKDTLAFSLSAEKARLLLGSDGQINGIDEVSGSTFEAILRNATVSNNPLGYMQIKDHGLVYADYYLIEFGTRLLRLGMV